MMADSLTATPNYTFMPSTENPYSPGKNWIDNGQVTHDNQLNRKENLS